MTQNTQPTAEQIASILGATLASLLTSTPVRTINSRLYRAGTPSQIKPHTVYEKLSADPQTAAAIMELVRREATCRAL